MKGNEKLMGAFCGMIARSPTNCGSTIDIPRRTLMRAPLKCWDFAMLGSRYLYLAITHPHASAHGFRNFPLRRFVSVSLLARIGNVPSAVSWPDLITT